MGNFTFQGHLEVKIKMSANVRHESHPFLQATIVNAVLVCAVLDQRRRRCTALTLGQRCIGALHMFCVCWVPSRHDAFTQ